MWEAQSLLIRRVYIRPGSPLSAAVNQAHCSRNWGDPTFSTCGKGANVICEHGLLGPADLFLETHPPLLLIMKRLDIYQGLVLCQKLHEGLGLWLHEVIQSCVYSTKTLVST